MNIVFDLGGVLVRIGQTWKEIASAAGVPYPYKEDLPRAALPCFHEYEIGNIDQSRYLDELAEFLRCSPEMARRAHMAVLVGMMPGAEALLLELRRKGAHTACFSNTNPDHWRELRSSDRFEALSLLEMRFASCEMGTVKPYASSYAYVQERLGLPILFFDDSEENVEGAREAGWDAHWLAHDDPIGQIRSILAAKA